EADAAHRGGRDLGATRRERVEHHLLAGIAGGAEQQPRRETLAINDQRIEWFHRHPPCMARTISTTSPGLSGVAAHAARRTTAPLSATARPRPSVSFLAVISSATVRAASGSAVPLMRIMSIMVSSFR